MYWLTLAENIGGLCFSVVGTIATVIGLVPTFRHKVVKSVAYSIEMGKYAARMSRPPRSRYDYDHDDES